MSVTTWVPCTVLVPVNHLLPTIHSQLAPRRSTNKCNLTCRTEATTTATTCTMPRALTTRVRTSRSLLSRRHILPMAPRLLSIRSVPCRHKHNKPIRSAPCRHKHSKPSSNRSLRALHSVLPLTLLLLLLLNQRSALELQADSHSVAYRPHLPPLL
jgi:hypothetical protein